MTIGHQLRSWKMEKLWFSLVAVLAATVGVWGQRSTEGFISIDCGIADGSGYADGITHIPYTSDTQFIDTGTIHTISTYYQTNSLQRQLLNLRSFPNGSRNCYTLKPVLQGQKYLIRSFFLYGNYDGLQSASAGSPILFDLYLGVNLWTTVNVSLASAAYGAEALAVASDNSISVCLANTGSGTPFISALELRPLKVNVYPAVNTSTSLVTRARYNVGPTTEYTVRYPDDPHDRLWKSLSNPPFWSELSTASVVQSQPDDLFEAPSAVLQTAAVPANSTELMFQWTTSSVAVTRPQYHIVMHFAELIQSLPGNLARSFNITLNGEFAFGPYTPSYLLSRSVYTTKPYSEYQYNFTLFPASLSSHLPPLLNAIEIYTVSPLTEIETYGGDVDAMMAMKTQYQVKRNWMGDPCSPRLFAWDGLNCSYSISGSPRIIALNLSSSGLTGVICPSIANLTMIKALDLSYNKLTGPIPNFLAELSSLQLLNMMGNNLSGSIPSALLERSQYGSLTLSIGGNPNLSNNENSYGEEKKKKKISTPVIVIIAIVAVVLLGLLLMFVVFLYRRRQGSASPTSEESVKSESQKNSGQQVVLEDRALQFENRQFTYRELEKITSNFGRPIGKGGFGTVYYGLLENGAEVAVKLRSQSSTQGAKELLAEARHLTRVHHRNLVTLVGYCKDGNYLALVYEYISEGSLRDHLRGNSGYHRVLRWGERLRIAIEAAQGLEYLHKGCRPPIIHRDVKSSNILLTQSLEAKIADFGLSRSFQNDTQTHISTGVAGTLGYLDPEYCNTLQLNDKSDVFSFGVVLLELITGQPPILPTAGNRHIVEWARSMLAQGKIADVVDVKLQGGYDMNSMWKAADTALWCTAQVASQRGTMSEVVAQLKDILALEDVRNSSLFTDSGNMIHDGSFETAHGVEASVMTRGPSAR